ncbi:GTPase Era, mitochondrial [Liasis olivaceus]
MAAPASVGLGWLGSRALGLASRRAWAGRGPSRCARSGASLRLDPASARAASLWNSLPAGTGPRQPRRASPARPRGRESALDHLAGIAPGEAGPSPPPACAFQDEHEVLLAHHPDQPENPKILRVAIIGAPNAGKSTLSNQLLQRKILPVSRKVHTTRCNAQGVITTKDTQLIILDTPGLTTSAKGKRHNLEKNMLSDPLDSLKNADLVLVLVDVSDRYTRDHLHPQVLHCLKQFPQIPSVLVLNKVDLVKKKGLLLGLVVELTEGAFGGKKLEAKSMYRPDVSREPCRKPPKSAQTSAVTESTPAESVESQAEVVTEDAGLASAKESGAPERMKYQKGWPFFREIFMLTALEEEEVETLKKYLLKQAQPGPWEFHSEVLTSQSPQEICANLIREKLLEHLPQEVPYAVTQKTAVWEEGPGGELIIVQNLEVQREKYMKMLIGYQGQVISKIAAEAGHDLMNAFLCEVQLKLSVQLKK